MRILALDTFLHEKNRYEKDVKYEVPDNEGFYFVMNGWAQDLDAAEKVEAPVAEEVNLNIHNSSLGLKDEFNG